MPLENLLGDGETNSDGIDLDTVTAEDAYQMLVGEKGKFKTPQDLARSALYKEQHIARLEKELADMRKTSAKSGTIEEILAMLSQSKKPDEQASPQDNVDKGSKGDIDIAALVEKEFQRKEAERLKREEDNTKAQNKKEFVNKLKEAWGPSFKTKLQETINSMGISETALVTLAETNPALVIRALGVTSVSDPLNNLPEKSKVSGIPHASGSTRNNAFYKKMLKENPKLYWSPQTQRQRLQDAKQLGDAFFS